MLGRRYFLPIVLFLVIQLILISIISQAKEDWPAPAGCGWGDYTPPCGPIVRSPPCHHPQCH
ncbi:hypothetical protein BDA96_05G222100 [Sorghum bicolor]|uniref:Uncharacterized protein n=2 Tax=Sorghum bicolor TaxID=4558 RepID=C5Y7F2_SORBI|nr:hypothetical protein SORBI_3005G205400 [Sorghum bicolor]KAG0530845.1 hypothetical protein BDA96_05G222100 [Sorghum bicolor]